MIGVIVGMRSEAKLLSKGTLTGISGGRPDKAFALATQMLEAGAEGLLSFGIAGGLDPKLRSGTLVVASGVVNGAAGLIECHPNWRESLLRRLPEASTGIVVGTEQAASDIEGKAALYHRWQASAVDLESGPVARACARAGKPFALLRAIADPADRAIPSAALNGLGEDGQARPFAVMLQLILRPWELPALIGLAADAKTALAALGDAVALLDPAFGFEPAGLIADQ